MKNYLRALQLIPWFKKLTLGSKKPEVLMQEIEELFDRAPRDVHAPRFHTQLSQLPNGTRVVLLDMRRNSP